ncbi:hypothetical protein [Streptomyces sp. H34-S4]|uniref:hypothetical protein n=1 Tax=Streptomyces sp. H34-S4 TaxID=2996463 RepID=UPI00227022E0|nr:hypothetical protein [Streptomyces sp. H34-S4]MCY0933869.1 hypothetical protein [Streptomyces sp. H34-S4]
MLSLETGVRMLQDAGYPIEDAREEVAQIAARRQSPDNRSEDDEVNRGNQPSSTS